MMMKKIGQAAAGVAIAAMLCATPLLAQAGKEGMSEDQQAQANDIISMFQDKIKHRFAPLVKDVKIGAATVGQPIEVTVTAEYDSPKAIDKITEAAVYYLAPGEDELEGPVKLTASGKNTFTGKIPAVDEAGELMVIPYVKDSYGNVGIELGCNVSEWPPFEDPCMVPGAVDADPLDDPPAVIADEFDIWASAVGMDDDYIYLMIETEGDISQGTMNPMHINAYLSLIVDTPTLYEIDDITVFMDPSAKEKFKDKADKATMVFYAPLAPKIDSKFKGCFIPNMKAGEGMKEGEEPTADQINDFMDSESVACKKDGPNFYTRIKKSALNDSMRKSFSTMISLNGFIENMQMPIPSLKEILPMTKVNWKPHKVTVK